jgi:hypothetical protein
LIQSVGQRIADAANSVSKGQYESGQSFADLYPTTGTSDDYAYSRHLLDSGNKTYAYTLEYGGTEFFPTYDKMLSIIKEVNSAMLELCDAMVAIATESRVTPPLSGH